MLPDTHDVYTWGDQENGVAGHGETEGHQYLPRMVAALRDKETIQVAACGFHTAALTASGRIYTWGEGKFARLGHGDERNRSVPTVIASLAAADVNIAQVACGGFHSAAFSGMLARPAGVAVVGALLTQSLLLTSVIACWVVQSQGSCTRGEVVSTVSSGMGTRRMKRSRNW